MRTLLIDNYDSYTYNLFQLIAETYGREPVVVANDAPQLVEAEASTFDAIVISPGPGHPGDPRDTGGGLEAVRRLRLPVLGVCLGHQALAWLADAEVVAARRPRHGHLERIRHVGDGLFAGLPQHFMAVRYHSLCVATPLPASLRALAWSDDGVLMALEHTDLPWWGVQFHPESIATEHGRQLLENFAFLVASPRAAAPQPPPRPVIEEFPATHYVIFERIDAVIDPGHAFDTVFGTSQPAFWLDTTHLQPDLSRFSFMGDAGGGLGEILSYRVGDGTVNVTLANSESFRVAGSIFDVLNQRLQTRRVAPEPRLPFDLTSGYVGYFGYELKADVGAAAAHSSPLPDAVWMTATRMVAFDHEQGGVYVVATHDGTAGSLAESQNWSRATAGTLRELASRAQTRAAPCDVPAVQTDPARWLVRGQTRYLEDVHRCQRELRAGQSYEICLTDMVEVPCSTPPEVLYRRLREANPAPYGAFLRIGELSVLCSSPERFLRVDGNRMAETRPIKGTATRHADAATDARVRRDLALGRKTRAENLMIVDLLRNDLGRICEVGSVEVTSLMSVETYATVHQLVSTIQGQLRADVGAVAAARACFPGGSMTGAPKLRTMAILDDIETRARGVYSGALGYFGASGTCDLAITIRTIVVADDHLTIGAGGAIVLDSDPAEEYEEMLIKARATLRVVDSVDVHDDSHE